MIASPDLSGLIRIEFKNDGFDDLSASPTRTKKTFSIPERKFKKSTRRFFKSNRADWKRARQT